MKRFFLLITLLLISTGSLLPSAAQESTDTWLPVGAKMRLNKGVLTCVAYSPDGTKLAVGSEIGISVYDTETHEQLAFFTGGHPQEIRFVTFSPDGQTLAIGASGGWRENAVHLWDIETGDIVRTFIAHGDVTFHESHEYKWKGSWRREDCISTSLIGGGSYFAAFSPDGQLLATTNGSGNVDLWDVAAGYRIRTIETGDRSSVYAWFSEDGKTLMVNEFNEFIVGEYETEAGVWDVETGQFLGVAPSGWLIQDGKIRVTQDDGISMSLWDAETGEFIRRISGFYFRNVAFSPDGQTFAKVGYTNSAVSFYDVNTGAWLNRREDGTVNSISGYTTLEFTDVAFSPDGQTLAAAHPWRISLWDAETGDLQRTIGAHSSNVTDIAFSPDGRLLASVSYDRTVSLWDTETGRWINTFTGHAAGVESVSFSPDGNTIASGSQDDTVRLWDASLGAHLGTLEIGHRIHSVAFSPDGRVLAIAGGYSKSPIQLWDVETRTLINAIARGPGGEIRDERGSLWDENGYFNKNLTTLPGEVLCVKFSPDGRFLASAGKAHEFIYSLHLWDAKTGDHVRTFIENGSEADFVAFSPDGQTLVSAGKTFSTVFSRWDTTLTFWDVSTGERLATFTGRETGHTREITSVAFSPDGQRFATSSRDGTVLVWDYPIIPTTPVYLDTDVNEDGVVNIQDLVYVSRKIGDTCIIDASLTPAPADVNEDGVVDLSDLVLVSEAMD